MLARVVVVGTLILGLGSHLSASVVCDCETAFATETKKGCHPWLCTPLPIESRIKKFGYPVESHDILTEDGYMLLYHRIPPKEGPGAGRPVLLQHGLLASSSCWVLSENSLAYTLANAGFDVWLGNARGNTYSRRHTKHDPEKDEKEFWDFSWHEMGYYDLPASIDYILNQTGRSQLVYIGHSMGTTMYFVLGATRPEYMDKVETAVLLAPVAFPWNVRSPLARYLQSFHSVLNVIAVAFNLYEVFPHSDSFIWLDHNVCNKEQFKFICEDLLFFVGGLNEKELNRTSFNTVLEYMPAGTSFKTIKHFRQISEKETEFRHFDYGFIKNMMTYRSFYPPSYDLTKVTAPTYLYYAMNDWLAVPEDVDHLATHLPNLQRVTRVSDDMFNHLDFMWAIDAKTLLYNDVIAAITVMKDAA